MLHIVKCLKLYSTMFDYEDFVGGLPNHIYRLAGSVCDLFHLFFAGHDLDQIPLAHNVDAASEQILVGEMALLDEVVHGYFVITSIEQENPAEIDCHDVCQPFAGMCEGLLGNDTRGLIHGQYPRRDLLFRLYLCRLTRFCFLLLLSLFFLGLLD